MDPVEVMVELDDDGAHSAGVGMADQDQDFAAALRLVTSMKQRLDALTAYGEWDLVRMFGADEMSAAEVSPFSVWKGKVLPSGPDMASMLYQSPRIVRRLRDGLSPQQVIDEFASLVEDDAADFMSVFLVRGLTVGERTELEDGMWLCPPTDAPMCDYRDAIFQGSSDPGYVPGGGFLGFDDAPKCALVVRETISPISYGSHEEVHATAAKRYEAKIEKALDVHRALILGGMTPVAMPIYYTACDTPSLPTISKSMSSFTSDGMIYPDASVDLRIATEFYRRLRTFPKPASLRVAIDRIGKSRLSRSAVDISIDLGLAMEVLLLHDDTDRNKELNHKIGLRAGWLMGGRSIDERKYYKRHATELYAARSTAAHEGVAKSGFDNEVANVLVTDLARTILWRGSFPDWTDLTFGGDESPQMTGSTRE